MKRRIPFLAFIGVLAIGVLGFLGYTAPFTNELPENVRIQVRYNSSSVWIEDQAQVNAIAELLENVPLQREIFKTDGYFPGDRYIRSDEYVILGLYENNTTENQKHIGDYSIILTYPQDSRYVRPSDNNRDKYILVDAQEHITKLVELLQTAGFVQQIEGVPAI